MFNPTGKQPAIPYGFIPPNAGGKLYRCQLQLNNNYETDIFHNSIWIDFLRRFYNYELPKVSRHSIDVVKDIIVLEQTDNYIFSGKTGGGMLTETDYIMWLVGYVEKDNKVYFYAMNFKTTDFNKSSQARYEITKDILSELKLIE